MKIVYLILFLFVLVFFFSNLENRKGIDNVDKNITSNNLVEEVVHSENVIIINAEKWKYDKTEIKLKQWEKVKIKIINSDQLHWIAVPDMQLVWDSEIAVDTSKVWEFEFRCLNYCWDWHEDMIWKIIIE